MSRIGLDPEVAIVNKNSGEARSAHLFINRKQKFTFYRDSGVGSIKGSEVERDGAAIEVRSIVPSACRDNIIPYVAEALRQTSLKLEKKWKGAFALSTTPVYTLDALSLKEPPDDVIEFGCRPDLDAYALDVKDPVCEPGDPRRYTGGHIHYSTMGAKNDVEQQAALAILFDYFVALPMVAILGEKFADGEASRRQYYGQPGSFRYDDRLDKIEFRTLSGRALLHPTLLYYLLGAMKTMKMGVGRYNSNYVEFLQQHVIKNIKPDVVHDVILTHNWQDAERLAVDVWSLLPSYSEDKSVLANPMSSGGSGTTNPYFYKRALEVFIEGNHEGLMWNDDMKFNWGLYEDYQPKHHAYWGIQQAMVGLLDDDIFPFNAILPKLWEKDFLQKKHMYTHPTNGGSMEYVTSGAAGWLQ